MRRSRQQRSRSNQSRPGSANAGGRQEFSGDSFASRSEHGLDLNTNLGEGFRPIPHGGRI